MVYINTVRLSDMHLSTNFELYFPATEHQGTLLGVHTSAGRHGLVVSVSDCGVRGPRFESHRRQLCLS